MLCFKNNNFEIHIFWIIQMIFDGENNLNQSCSTQRDPKTFRFNFLFKFI